MRKKVSLLFWILSMSYGCSASATLTADNDKSIAAMIDQALVEDEIPAIGALIVRNGNIIHLSATGKRSAQHPISVQVTDKWHLGSDTKAMTAFLIALAVQENRISYESKVSKALGLDSVFEDNIALSVSDLLSHRSYLKDVSEIRNGTLWKEIFTSQKPLVEQRLQMGTAALKEAPRKLNDGTLDYANINYILLGSILEQIYDSDWESLLKNKVFTPLRMSSCGFGVAGDMSETSPSEPWPHTVQNKKLIGIPPRYKADNPPMLGPAGTVHCNLEDWNKFIQELIATNNERGSLLKKSEVIQKYFNPPSEGHIYTLGGWGYDNKKLGYPIYQHSGSNTFNFVTAFFAPKENFVVLLTTNTAHPKAEEQLQNILKDVISRYLKK